MRFMHLSDLHLGKRVNGFSMLEDQRFILDEIFAAARDEAPDAVLIAGDVYDRAVPTAEAVELFDSFLVRLSGLGPQIFVISGNHDSAERLAFGGRLMELSGVHMAPVYRGSVSPFVMKDEWGEVNIYMLPFVKPASVRPFFPAVETGDYSGAVKAAIDGMGVDPSARNVLVCHQFAAGSDTCESEDIMVGGEGSVDVSLFEPFDYTAMGHLHSPQNAGSERVRYCGSPLKYSFSEIHQTKSVSMVTLGKKGDLAVRTVPLVPLREMREIRGTYDEVSLLSFYKDADFRDQYLHITLTDESSIPEGLSRLQAIYPFLMKLDYDNERTRTKQEIQSPAELWSRTPLDLFEEFYRLQNGMPMNGEQREYVSRLIKKVWEEEI
jgi:exonuclease SbcD